MKRPLALLLILTASALADPPVFPPGASTELKKAIIKDWMTQQQIGRALEQQEQSLRATRDAQVARAKEREEAVETVEIEGLVLKEVDPTIALVLDDYRGKVLVGHLTPPIGPKVKVRARPLKAMQYPYYGEIIWVAAFIAVQPENPQALAIAPKEPAREIDPASRAEAGRIVTIRESKPRGPASRAIPKGYVLSVVAFTEEDWIVSINGNRWAISRDDAEISSAPLTVAP